MQVDDKNKQASLDVAEDSREKEWTAPSFVAELFKGRFAWQLIHPYPLQEKEDKRIGDEFMVRVQAVLEKYIDPSEVDRTREVPREGLRALAELGVFGMKIPQEYGGLGFSQINYSRIAAFIGSYCAATAAWVTSHQSIGVPQPLKLFGTKEQKERFLPRLAKGAISAFALTEPGVGSDPAKMTTTAEPTADGRHYIIKGQKLWITNGTSAELLVVMARTPSILVNGKEKQQISAFVVETDTPGFSVVHRCDFMGIRGIANGLLNFDNVKVPAENLIGKLGEGLKIALITLNTGRLSLPAGAGAGGKKALSYGSKWGLEREQWGAPIGKHQSTAIKLAQMASNTFAIEAITWLGCAMADRGGADIRLEAAMAKYFATEAGWKIADDFVQLRGGRGFETAESLAMRGEDPVPAERFLRDARIARIVEGTSEIMQLFIAREAMDVHVRQILPLLDPRANKIRHFTQSFLPFYLRWYPRQWLPGGGPLETQHLNARNRAHLVFIQKTAKRLARTMFHTMARFQQKLEREQLIMAQFVDIGTGLFSMAASLAYAEALLAEGGNEEEIQDVVDLYCEDTRVRIAQSFHQVRHNHNRLYNKVANAAMQGRYEWLCADVYEGIPPGYLKYMNQSLDEFARLQEARGKLEGAPASREPVSK